MKKNTSEGIVQDFIHDSPTKRDRNDHQITVIKNDPYTLGEVEVGKGGINGDGRRLDLGW